MDEQLVLKTWKRYGHDRTYVQTAAGASLGYLDNKTGAVVVEDETSRAAVQAALGLTVVGQPEDLEPYAVTIPHLAVDLAENQAGASARVKVLEYRSAAPVKTTLARLLGVHTDERAWRVGAQGERIVGQELERLVRHGWHVLHDVPVGERGANIDHVLVGPAGVFTVNSKYHWGSRVWAAGNTVKVNGQYQPYVPKARSEAQRAARLLGRAWGRTVEVHGILAIVCDNRVVKSQPADGSVRVMGPRESRRYVEALPARLAPEEVQRLAYLARRSTTWQS